MAGVHTSQRLDRRVGQGFGDSGAFVPAECGLADLLRGCEELVVQDGVEDEGIAADGLTAVDGIVTKE